MLLKFRGGLDSILIKILLAALIGAFAIWGIGPSMLNVGNQNVATVGETDISAQRYFREVQNRAQNLQQQFGGQYSSAQIITLMRLDDQVLQQLVAQAAVTQHMKDLGMRATNDQVAKELLTIDAFTLPDGSFSRDLMDQALGTAGISEQVLLDDLRDGISRNFLLTSLTNENMATTSTAKALYAWRAERRRATMINFQASDITDVAAPTDEELQTYYEENKASYMTPERRSYRYILATPAQFASKVEVDEAAIEQEYNARINEYVQPEKRKLQQVSFTEKSAADAFLSVVNTGADFVEAGTSVSEFTAEEINLGDFSKDDLASTFDQTTADVVYGLEIGAVSRPLQGLGGYSIFRVAEVIPANSRSLEDVKTELTTLYKNEEAINLMYDFQKELDVELDNEPNLEVIAEKFGINLAAVTNVDNRGQNESGVATVTSQEEFSVLSDINQREIGDEPEVVDVDPRDSDKGIFLAELIDIKAPEQRSFDDMKSEMSDRIVADRKIAKAGELAESAKTRLEAGEAAEKIAEELNGTSFDAKNIARSGDANSNLSANIRRLIFDLSKNQIDFERSTDNNGYVVVRVDDVRPGDASAKPTELQAIVAELNAAMTNEIFAQYQAYLLSTYEPVVNQQLKQQLFTDQNIQ